MVLVRPLLTGFCGSDRGIWHRRSFGDMIAASLDEEGRDVRVIGHELLGEIVEVGAEAVRDFGYRPGDIVSAESHIVDDTCYQCRVGDKHVCATAQIIGISLDGCFSELVKLPAKTLWPTDIRKIRPEVAALQEPFGNAVHACTKVNLRGQSVAIIGLGTIGLFAVAVARALGARADHRDRAGGTQSRYGPRLGRRRGHRAITAHGSELHPRRRYHAGDPRPHRMGWASTWPSR